MSEEGRLGLMLLALTCSAPALVGGAVGWWLRGRVDQYGWFGALLPGFIREMLG